jgi:hypothetical protein
MEHIDSRIQRCQLHVVLPLQWWEVQNEFFFLLWSSYTWYAVDHWIHMDALRIIVFLSGE